MRPAADSKVNIQRVGSLSYRQRESTIYRGVTKTSGTNSGVEKFDVQFVFCDNGTKRHPKIYGFQSAASAARAFDILTCKRAVEKSRLVSAVLTSIQSLGTNHPPEDYASEPLLSLLHSQSRDDVIYALKQCAKRGLSLEPSNLLTELGSALDASRLEAVEKERIGDLRQSYEATVKPITERKRKQSLSTTVQLNSQLNMPHVSPSQQQQEKMQQATQQQHLGELHRQQGDKLAALLSSGLTAISPPSGQPVKADLVGFKNIAASLLLDGVSAGQNQPGTFPPHTSTPVSTPPSLHQQLLLLQALQGQNAGDLRRGSLTSSAILPPLLKSEAPALPLTAIEGIEFIMECIRLASSSTPELSAAHDLLHIWACLIQGRPWAQEKLNLPHWYYLGLLPSLQNCVSLSGLCTLCGHLWRSGGLSVMLAAMTGGLPQATVISILQNVAAAVPASHSTAEASHLPSQHQQQHSGATMQHALSLMAAALQQQQREGGHGPTQDSVSALLAAVGAASHGASGTASAALQQLLDQSLVGGNLGTSRGFDSGGVRPFNSLQLGGNSLAGPEAWPSSQQQGFQQGSPSNSGRVGLSWSASLSGRAAGGRNASGSSGAGNPQLAQILQLLGGGSAQPQQANTLGEQPGREVMGLSNKTPYPERCLLPAGVAAETGGRQGSSTRAGQSPSKEGGSRDGGTGGEDLMAGKGSEAAFGSKGTLGRGNQELQKGRLWADHPKEGGDGTNVKRSKPLFRGLARSVPAGRSYSLPAAQHSSLDFDAVVEAAAAALGADTIAAGERSQQESQQGLEHVTHPQQAVDLRMQDHMVAGSQRSPFLDEALRGASDGLSSGNAGGGVAVHPAAKGSCEEEGDGRPSPHPPTLLSVRSSSLPTRPQPKKAPLAGELIAGTESSGFAKDRMIEEAGVQAQATSGTGPFEAPTALHRQPNSAFSKFQQAKQSS